MRHAARPGAIAPCSAPNPRAVAPPRVAAQRTLTHETDPQPHEADGGFGVPERPPRDAATHRAAKLAHPGRRSQELREYHYDPES